ncbi:MAG: flagellar assembly protein FliH [Gammaproteobacteria bacterium]|nr:flagellar assembly protein FliH [Gammaproteobacteria bacterium]MDE2250134.1 flagellar assembly protein FliH [Gammaproteobacteria bacterium]
MSESAAANVLAWALPQVEGPVVGQRRIADLNLLEREAWEQGFAAGRTAGRAAALGEQETLTQELRARVQRLDALLDLQARPLAELDEQVLRQLATLAGAIARQLVRRELRTQPEQIIAVIRATVALLPAAARDVRIHLHPDDAALVRERLVEPAAERAWTLVEDPVLTRGGCRIGSDNSSIDAQVEARLGAAIAAVLGDERSPAVAAAP